MLYNEMMSRTRRSISMRQNIFLVAWVQIRTAEVELRSDSVPDPRTCASLIIYRYVSLYLKIRIIITVLILLLLRVDSIGNMTYNLSTVPVRT